MAWQDTMRAVAKWTIPIGFKELIVAGPRALRSYDPVLRSILASNRVFQNAHKGQRCFILGSGPSINTQDLTPLANEVCIAYNSFYLYKDYESISPRYHWLSSAREKGCPPEVSLEWFREAEERVRAGVIFTDYDDRDFHLRHGTLKTREVHYLKFRGRMEDLRRNGIDITKAVHPNAGSCGVVIQLAIYMGFKEIYLLGVDHDWILRYPQRLHTHFFDPGESAMYGKRNFWIEGGYDFGALLKVYHKLWSRYGIIRQFAESIGVRICNATAGGLLDVFERADYNSLVK